jgi:hypothetical protein
MVVGYLSSKERGEKQGRRSRDLKKICERGAPSRRCGGKRRFPTLLRGEPGA